MRLILTILTLLITTLCFSQTKTVAPQLGNSNSVNHYGAITSDSVDYKISGCGTPTRNMLNYIAAKRGSAEYIDTCSNTPYWYSPATNRWFTIAGGGGSGDTAIKSAILVDTISTFPRCGDVTGSTYLILGTVPPKYMCTFPDSIDNPFYGHQDNIATYDGADYSFDTATNGEYAVVTTPITQLYQYLGGAWHFIRLLASIGGDSIKVVYPLGNLDAFSTTIISKGQTVIEAKPTGQVSMPLVDSSTDTNDSVLVVHNGEIKYQPRSSIGIVENDTTITTDGLHAEIIIPVSTTITSGWKDVQVDGTDPHETFATARTIDDDGNEIIILSYQLAPKGDRLYLIKYLY